MPTVVAGASSIFIFKGTMGISIMMLVRVVVVGIGALKDLNNCGAAVTVSQIQIMLHLPTAAIFVSVVVAIKSKSELNNRG